MAVLCMLVGTVMLLRTVLHARTTIDGLYRKGDRIQQLEVVKMEADILRSAMFTLERDTTANPTRIDELTRTYLEGADVTPRMLDAKPAQYGWEIQRAEITFSHLRFEQISLFLKKAEDQRPPWRIKSMSLRPHDASGLSGKLELHALQKTEI
jgi:hypothetical protein